MLIHGGGWGGGRNVFLFAILQPPAMKGLSAYAFGFLNMPLVTTAIHKHQGTY